MNGIRSGGFLDFHALGHGMRIDEDIYCVTPRNGHGLCKIRKRMLHLRCKSSSTYFSPNPVLNPYNLEAVLGKGMRRRLGGTRGRHPLETPLPRVRLVPDVK